MMGLMNKTARRATLADLHIALDAAQGGDKARAISMMLEHLPLHLAIGTINDNLARIAKRSKPVKATELNIWVLERLAAGRIEFPNQIEAVSVPHIRRCVSAGLVTIINRSTLRLTAEGCSALNIKAAA